MDETEKLLFSIKVTSKCRYQASVRLSLYNHFCFFTTTVLSLGLIFIPLMQMSGVKLYFNSQIINALQIFLAVAILVFSNIISSANYAVRAQNLNACGDALKKLARKIAAETKQDKKLSQTEIAKYIEEYSNITEKYENHIRTDYKQTLFDVRNERITGIRWVNLNVQIVVNYIIDYFVPICLMVFEIVLILDMLGVTQLLAIFIIKK